jgi:hypothetical protein
MKAAGTSAARLTAATLIIGVLIVVLSQVVAGFVIEDQFGVPIDTATLLEKHGPWTIFLALIALAGLAWAVLAGSRVAVALPLAMGIAVILIFLLIDLPDLGTTGLFDAPGAGNLDGTARSDAGLWMELIGGVVILLASIGLATLDESALRSILPRSGRGSRRTVQSRTRTRRTDRSKPFDGGSDE